jgi:hypothetical protein
MLFNTKLKPMVEMEQRRNLFGIDDLIGGAVGGIGSLVGGLVGSGDTGLSDQALTDIQNLPTGYTPEMYQYIAENAPQLFELPTEVQAQVISEDPTLRAMQTKGLGEMQDVAEKGITAKDQQSFNAARQKAGTEARGQNEAVISDLAARGRSGSGIEAALRQMANQSAQDSLSGSLDTQATADAEARQTALNNLLTQTAGVRNQDFTANKANTDIINDFNLYNSANTQKTKNANVELNNAYNQRNTSAQRDVANSNTNLRNQATIDQLNNQYRQTAMATPQANANQNTQNTASGAVGRTITNAGTGIGQMIAGAGGQSTGSNNYWNNLTPPYSYGDELKNNGKFFQSNY